MHCSIMGFYAHVQLYQNALKHYLTNEKVSVLTYKLHLCDIPNCRPIVQVSGSPQACILELFSVLYLYDFMTKNSKICEYQTSQVHRSPTTIFYEEHILALLKTFLSD